MTAPVQIQVDGQWARVYSPFTARDILRAMPVRKWDAERKCWSIPAPYVWSLVEQLKAVGLASEVHGAEPARTQQQSRSWAEAMFAELPRNLHVAAYRAMAKVLHPDTGGDDVAMKQLNDARDRAGGHG